MSIVPAPLAAKLDQKAAEGWIIPNWRQGWKFWSIWANALIIVAAIANGVLWAAPLVGFVSVYPKLHLALSVMIVVLVIAGTVSQLFRQPNLKPKEPADEDDGQNSGC